DSRTIVFGSQNRLMKVSVSGGPPVKLCDISGPINVGFWTPDNRIVFGTTISGVFEVPAAGCGVMKPLTQLAAGETQHAPQGLLPDGRHFLYLVRGASDHAGVNIRRLDEKPEMPGSRLLTDDTSALFAPSKSGSKPGWIVFVRENTLLAQPFDPNGLEVAGDPIPIGPSAGNLGGFSVSETGDLVYGNVGQGNRQLDWYDRKGTRIETAWKGRSFNEIELSPDGKQVAAVDSPATTDIWIYDFSRKSENHVAAGVHPVWSPDGQRLIWGGFRGIIQFQTRAASGADAAQPFAEGWKSATYPSDLSTDGRFLLAETGGDKTGRDLMVLPVEGGKPGPPKPYLFSENDESSGRFSPTTSYVAHVMRTGSRSEVYVSTFPDPTAGKWPISAAGGYQPRWSRDGKELFYLTADGRLMRVEVRQGASPFGVATELFQVAAAFFPATNNQTRWDLTRDGQRFLFNTLTGDTSAPLTVVVNWQAGL
ncbi:MAG TPA: hypothetical protein VFR18_22740, partial [Terriglobia bacterium]|nr:hypothetical protein [Terriglobia bacterium]